MPISRDIHSPRDFVRRLVLAELLARRGEGPLALRASWGMRRTLGPSVRPSAASGNEPAASEEREP